MNVWFESINKSEKDRYDINEIVYSSKSGELLEVVHDLESLKKKSPSDWKNLFDSRFRDFKFPNQSGIWNKREWVLPHIQNENIVSFGEGLTPLVESKRLTDELGLKNLYIKQCGISHTGSFKDLGMTVLLSQVKHMISNSVPIDAVACASSGDTSAALASYAALANIPSIIFLPKGKVSPAQLIQPVSNGALVIAMDTDFDGCMEIVKLVTKEKSIYLANSMNSLRIEGQKTISIEITQQLGWEVPDWVFIPGGNLGNVSALGAGFLMMKNLGIINKLPRIVVSQARNANPLFLSYLDQFRSFEKMDAKETLASAIQIGNPVSIKKAISTLKEFDGVVEDASEEELSDVAARVDRYGFYVDPHTSVALTGLFKLIDKKKVLKGERVVIISTASALKFTEFKLKFHNNQITGTNQNLINQIHFSEPKLGNVLDIINKKLKKS